MINLLVQNPLLLLFVVAAIGYPLGRVKIGGISLGVAAVLFVGLGIGSLNPDLKLPETIYNLGLVLFVYTIGLSNGNTFFTSFRKQGLRDNLLVLIGIFFAFGLVFIAQRILRLDGPLTAGLFSGSLANTPSLANILEYIQSTADPSQVDVLRSEPVVAYSLTYPMGLIGAITAIYLFQKVWKIDYPAEANRMRDIITPVEPLANRTLLFTQEVYSGQTVQQLIQNNHWNVIFVRRQPAVNAAEPSPELSLAKGQTRFFVGDRITLLGSLDEIDKVTRVLGEACDDHLEQDLSIFDKRRFFISNSHITGKKLSELDILDHYGAMITRIRRGDVELLPHGDTRLFPGDQVKVVARHDQMDALSSFFGDSYRAVSEVDILTFSLGLAIGILCGLAPISLPGGITIRLGLAGGPLLVALILGAIGRTGPMIWSLPYSANLTLRQIGLILFLAGVGTRSGYAFFSSLFSGDGLVLFGAGTAITLLTCTAFLWFGYKILKIPYGHLIGILAGMQTQTSVLGFTLDQSRSELPNLGYTTAYPVATITKIILAQIILIILK